MLEMSMRLAWEVVAVAAAVVAVGLGGVAVAAAVDAVAAAVDAVAAAVGLEVGFPGRCVPCVVTSKRMVADPG